MDDVKGQLEKAGRKIYARSDNFSLLKIRAAAPLWLQSLRASHPGFPKVFPTSAPIVQLTCRDR